MRLNLRLTGNTEPVSYNHLHQLTGCLHKWLGGENSHHDGTSLYSFGWLDGARPQNTHLTFPQGAVWRISFYRAVDAKTLLDGLLRDPAVFAGMRVFDAKEQVVPRFSGCYRFLVDGPVIARREREDGSKEYLLYDNKAADGALTRVLRWKLQQAGFNGEHLDANVQFDRAYQRARTQLAEIKGIKHKGSECPVIVTGTPDVVRFAWTVGVGELTGSGFGALK